MTATEMCDVVVAESSELRIIGHNMSKVLSNRERKEISLSLFFPSYPVFKVLLGYQVFKVLPGYPVSKILHYCG